MWPDCKGLFFIITCIENSDSLLSTEDSGKGEISSLAPIMPQIGKIMKYNWLKVVDTFPITAAVKNDSWDSHKRFT